MSSVVSVVNNIILNTADLPGNRLQGHSSHKKTAINNVMLNAENLLGKQISGAFITQKRNGT